MALRKALVLAVSAASLLASTAAFAQTDATAPEAPAKKTAQHAHKKGTHKKAAHKKTTDTTTTTETPAK